MGPLSISKVTQSQNNFRCIFSLGGAFQTQNLKTRHQSCSFTDVIRVNDSIQTLYVYTLQVRAIQTLYVYVVFFSRAIQTLYVYIVGLARVIVTGKIATSLLAFAKYRRQVYYELLISLRLDTFRCIFRFQIYKQRLLNTNRPSSQRFSISIY